MGIELNGANDIVRKNGNLPDEVVATKAGPSLTVDEISYLDSLPSQSKLKQAYLSSTAKTMLAAHQVASVQALVPGSGNVSVTHDGTGRVASVTRSGGRSFSYTYSSGSIVITADDGTTATVATDGTGRVTGVTGNF